MPPSLRGYSYSTLAIDEYQWDRDVRSKLDAIRYAQEYATTWDNQFLDMLYGNKKEYQQRRNRKACGL
jgi:hypothetical protein